MTPWDASWPPGTRRAPSSSERARRPQVTLCTSPTRRSTYTCNMEPRTPGPLSANYWFTFSVCILSVSGSYSLSIRDFDNNAGDGVKHYRIRNMDNGGFYITAKISFNSLKELVQHYSREYRLAGRWIRGLHLDHQPPPSFSRWLGWFVHKASEAVPIQSSPEALVAGRVGDSPWVPEAGAQTGSGPVRGGLDGWVAQRTTRSRSGLRGIKGFPFQMKEIEQLMLRFLTRLISAACAEWFPPCGL